MHGQMNVKFGLIFRVKRVPQNAVLSPGL